MKKVATLEKENSTLRKKVAGHKMKDLVHFMRTVLETFIYVPNSSDVCENSPSNSKRAMSESNFHS